MKKTVTGIIGYPLSHTLSPLMHNAVFKKYKMNWEYLAFETPPGEVKSFIGRMRKERIKGINVTIPHKQTVMMYLDRIDRAARTIGAVNTVVNRGGKLTGYNTDFLGFGRTLKEKGISLRGKRVVMFGAGGAAHAVGFEIKRQKPGSFMILNIDVPMIERMVKKLGIKGAQVSDLKKSAAKDAALAEADFIVNTTSVGMHNGDKPYNIERIKRKAVVYDIIYVPERTALLKEAAKKGARVMNGLDMLIYQGMEAFKIWTGRPSDYKLVSRKLREHFRNL